MFGADWGGIGSRVLIRTAIIFGCTAVYVALDQSGALKGGTLSGMLARDGEILDQRRTENAQKCVAENMKKWANSKDPEIAQKFAQEESYRNSMRNRFESDCWRYGVSKV